MFAAPLAIAIAVEAAPIVIAGAALSAVGGLTGSKELSMIGSFMGLAGGVFGGESLAGGADAFGGEGMIADAAGEVAGVADAASGAGFVGDLPVDPSLGQTTIAGGDVASDVLAQAGSVSQAAGETAGIQPPVVVPPAQAAISAPTSSPSAILGGETGAFDMGQFAPQDVGLAATSEAAKPGLIDSVLNWGKNNQLLAATGLKMGGEFLAKGLGRDAAAERVDLERQALEAKLAELDRTRANRGYVPSSIGMAPNPNANLYPQGYRPPLRGLIRTQMA